jgi:ABC-type multidrug transport system fused ATPase/permease subunit
MRSLLAILALARGRLRAFFWVALMVSIGTAASLFEPWIYRAIVDDIAGVFVAPRPVAEAEAFFEHVGSSLGHFEKSSKRIFRAPLQRLQAQPGVKRRLAPRTPPQAVATVILGACLLLVTRLLSELFRIRGDNRSTRISNDLERGYILRTFHHVLRLPLGFFARRASGAVARQIDQSDHVAPVFTSLSQEFWPDFFRLAAILAIMSSLNLTLALITFIAVPVYALVTWHMARRLETQLERYYGLWDEVSSRIQQAVAGIKTVITHGAAAWEERQLDVASGHAFDTYLERARVLNRYTFVQESIVTFSKAAALLLGGIKALQHQLTPGDVVLFVAYLDQVYSPIENLTELYTSLQEHLSSLKRAERLLETPSAPGEDRPPFVPSGGAIDFENVVFGYTPNRRVLDGVTFHIRAGEHVGLVGPSGAGKTTIIDLLAGLYQPDSGAIRIDGQRLDDVAPSSVRAAVRSVAADGTLFRMTVAENIRYARQEASDAEVAGAARLAGLEPLLQRLPEGLATPIGERGVELSVGERQRVLLARAFLARPAVLLLDEATANLDFKTEEAVKEALETISKGRTTVVVAHRRSMLTDVERALVLRDGRIEQDGTPAELLAVDGYFRQMIRAADAPAARARD